MGRAAGRFVFEVGFATRQPSIRAGVVLPEHLMRDALEPENRGRDRSISANGTGMLPRGLAEPVSPAARPTVLHSNETRRVCR